MLDRRCLQAFLPLCDFIHLCKMCSDTKYVSKHPFNQQLVPYNLTPVCIESTFRFYATGTQKKIETFKITFTGNGIRQK